MESWQTNRKVAPSIQRTPAPIRVPFTVGRISKKVFCGKAKEGVWFSAEAEVGGGMPGSGVGCLR